jgi:hypothetical protein
VGVSDKDYLLTICFFGVQATKTIAAARAVKIFWGFLFFYNLNF